jgi:hypothetical protein
MSQIGLMNYRLKSNSGRERKERAAMKFSKKAKYLLTHFLMAFALICVGVIAIWQILPVVIITPRERMQQELARELGVEIKDYPYPVSFPSGYFYAVLKPGMSVTEVHQIVKGYEKVVNCGNVSEIYYYFSTEVEQAKRFKIVYDNNGKFLRFEGEEDDSRTLQTDGCIPGLIEE